MLPPSWLFLLQVRQPKLQWHADLKPRVGHGLAVKSPAEISEVMHSDVPVLLKSRLSHAKCAYQKLAISILEA